MMSSVGRRLAERFALIAFGLYHVPLFLNNYPSLGGGGFNDTGLAPRWGRIFTIPSLWVAQHVLGIANPTGATGDNGDTSEEYARLLICVVVATACAIGWTIADRKRPRGEWVESGLRLLLRYSIALGMMSYAIAKVLPQQFPPISVNVLDSRVGDMSPMLLLWTFMQYSRPYAFIAGVAELAGALLLCFRRTATLGALVTFVVMTNVMLMNYAYGVPVKLYATMITVSAAVLLLYDARRLLAVLVLNRPVSESSESTVVQDRVPRGWRRGLKIAAVGSVMLSSVIAMAGTLRPVSSARDGATAEGTWRVIVAAPTVATTTPAAASPTSSATVTTSAAPTSFIPSWRTIGINRLGIVVRTTGDSVFGCRLKDGAATETLSMECRDGHDGVLRWTRAQDTLRLAGTFDGAPISMTASIVERASFPLMRSRFRWIIE